MPYKNLQKVFQYPDIYEYLAGGTKSLKVLYSCFAEDGMIGGSLKRRKEFLGKEPPYIKIDGDEIGYECSGLYEDLSYAIEKMCSREKDDDTENENLREQITTLEKEIQKQTEIITSFRQELDQLNEQYLCSTLQSKVLVASSIEAGPVKHPDDDLFLDDPQTLLDVEKLVSVYGGTLDSFYDVYPTDEELEMAGEKKREDPGRELTLGNYRGRMMKRIGLDGVFQKRLQDIEKVVAFESEHGKLFPDCIEEMYDPDDESTARKKERNRILRNRFETLNRIIQSDQYTNQEKLMLFALNAEFQNTEMEHLLRFAANYCINANLVIGILQNPNIAGNYHNMANFFSQFKNPSEFRMKLDLARELIAGTWYITADYNGKKTRFQLVPIEELNELRQKVGLPVSRFTYGKGGSTEERDGDGKTGEESGISCPKKARSAEPEHFDLPDDGLVPDTVDEDMPF